MQPIVIPAPKKRIPLISISMVAGETTATVRISWKARKPPLYMYNGETFTTVSDLGDANLLSEEEWIAAGSPLPNQNAQGETSTAYAEYEGVAYEYYVYARVRVGRAVGGWGSYGYFKGIVSAPAEGGSGQPGESAYVYIAYASDDIGTDFTMVYDESLDYIAILSTSTEIPIPAVGDFAGLWKRYGGDTSILPTYHISTGAPDDGIGIDGDIWVRYMP